MRIRYLQVRMGVIRHLADVFERMSPDRREAHLNVLVEVRTVGACTILPALYASGREDCNDVTPLPLALCRVASLPTEMDGCHRSRLSRRLSFVVQYVWCGVLVFGEIRRSSVVSIA